MFDAPPAPAAMQRARGAAEVSVALRAGRSRLTHLFQQGSARALTPRTHGAAPEAVIVNTAGGVTGGDRFRYAFAAGDGAALTVSTQAAERVYRASEGSVAAIDTTLRLGAGATLDWLPQETILFDACALRRTLGVDMAADARLTALETVVLGRTAMGETLTRAAFSDQWRIRRAGRLVHAEALRLGGAQDCGLADALRGPAALSGARAFATLVHAAPDAGDRLAEARALLAAAPCPCAATARDGVLVARFLGPDAAALRAALTGFLIAFRRAALPRVWAL